MGICAGLLLAVARDVLAVAGDVPRRAWSRWPLHADHARNMAEKAGLGWGGGARSMAPGAWRDEGSSMAPGVAEISPGRG